MFWCLVLLSSKMTFQSPSLKISLNWKQRMRQCSGFNQAQHYSKIWHKTSCFSLTWFKTTAKPIGCLQGASQASIAATNTFLTMKTYHGNQVTCPLDNKGSHLKKGLAIFPGIIPITNFLLCRSVNILPFAFLKPEQWATLTLASQKRVHFST